MAKIGFLAVIFLMLFLIVPILNTIVLTWTEDGGTLDRVFNATDESWNTTGTVLTDNQTSVIELTPMEKAFTRFYVPMIALFLVGIIFYVLRGNGGGNGE